MALIRMCVVPNCSQRLSRPVLWIVAVFATYWTHTTAVCVLMLAHYCFLCLNGSLNPPSASHTPLPPPIPLPPTHPLIRAICDITVAVKKVAQNPAVLASQQK